MSHKPDCISALAGLPKRDRVFQGRAWGPQSSGRGWDDPLREDVGDQGPDAAKAARDLGGDFAKEAFQQISQEEEVGMKWM